MSTAVRILFFVSTALFAVASAAAQSLPPVQAFGALPFLSDPQLSPDGMHFAAIQSMDGQPVAVIYPVRAPAGTAPQVFASQNWLINGLYWVKNDRLVMLTKTSRGIPLNESMLGNPDRYTWYRALSIQVGSPDWIQLFDKNRSASVSTGTTVVDADLDDPRAIYMPLWTIPKNSRTDDIPTIGYEGGYADLRFSLYRVDAYTGEAHVVQDGDRFPAEWIMDGHGKVVGRIDRSPSPLIDHVWLYRSGDWSEVMQFDARPDKRPSILGLTYDGKSLAIDIDQPNGRGSLRRLDLSTGQFGDVLFSDPHYDIYDALTDLWTQRVVGVSYMVDKMEYSYFDPRYAAIESVVTKLFPDQDVHPVSLSQDGSEALIAVESPDQPRTYYLYETATKNTTKIASEYPELKPRDLGEMQAYPFKARDGLDIPAYLTLPPGRPARNLPLVVMPHGGPDARDGVGFDWWAEFLANRGYAVFKPNFRGSFGYGLSFTQAGEHQWGLKMQDDITDGVKKLIADGIVDPKRICIVGASYGGYAALAGATFTPDLYACAVSFAGVSDLTAMLQRSERIYGEHSLQTAFWNSRIGTVGKDDARLDATSPVRHADQVRIPILLMHAEKDTTVPISQSEEERDALLKAGKNVKYIALEGDDHYFTLEQTRIQMLTAVEAFLSENIGH